MTAGAGAIYSITGESSEATAGAGATCSIAGAGKVTSGVALDHRCKSRGRGAGRGRRKSNAFVNKSWCHKLEVSLRVSVSDGTVVAVMSGGSDRHSRSLLLVPPKSTKSLVAFPPRGAPQHRCAALCSAYFPGQHGWCEKRGFVLFMIMRMTASSGRWAPMQRAMPFTTWLKWASISTQALRPATESRLCTSSSSGMRVATTYDAEAEKAKGSRAFRHRHEHWG